MFICKRKSGCFHQAGPAAMNWMIVNRDWLFYCGHVLDGSNQ